MALSYCQSMADEHGRELVTHGTAAFPIGCYYDDLAVNPVPWHWHDELEAVVVAEGSCIFAAGSEKYILQKGDGIFINAGVLHTVYDAENTGCCLHSITFHSRLVGGSPDSIYWLNYIQPLTTDLSLGSISLHRNQDWQKEALDAIETAWQTCVNEVPGYEFLVRNSLSSLIWLFVSHRAPAQAPPSEKALRDGERIKIMLQYIHDHFSEELITNQIAQSALISSSECLRCFRSTIGTTPIQYMKQYRVRQAARLLTSTQQKISEIGAQCGFQEMSYFAKTFKEFMGDTPSEYRRKNTAADIAP